MAAKSNTTVPATLSAEERAATILALRNQLLAGTGASSPSGNGVWGWVGDRLSTTGQGFSSVVAGGSAAVENFSLHYASEKVRQRRRTEAMADKLAAQLLEAQGL